MLKLVLHMQVRMDHFEQQVRFLSRKLVLKQVGRSFCFPRAAPEPSAPVRDSSAETFC